MKLLKRFVALLCVLVLGFSLFAVTAEAATKFTAIKTGKTYSAASTVKYYKLTLKKNSVVTVKWSGSTNSAAPFTSAHYNHFNIYLYGNKAMNDCILEPIDIISASASGTKKLALTKGTYYLQIWDSSHRAKVSFQVNPITATKNTTASKATTLKRNRQAVIAQTPKYFHANWYKITLTSSQYLHIYSSQYMPSHDISVYTKNLRPVPCDENEKTLTSRNKLAKGTYYICVQPPDQIWDSRWGVYRTIKWK